MTRDLPPVPDPAAQRPAPPEADSPPPRPPRPKKRDISGWIVLDKPVGMTSTHAVAAVKRLFHAKKAGHAGTLDPLASGLLPVALGEATKTVPFVMDGRKAYAFTVAWGEETDTDDAEGKVIARSDERPQPEMITELLPRFTGTILQVPPRFSAIKIDGERAYDRARDGEEVELKPRAVTIDRLTLVSHIDDRSLFEAECGKGTYVRAIARDLGRGLGCYGHVSALRRTRVGPFGLAHAVTLNAIGEAAANSGALNDVLLPVAAALGELTHIDVSRGDAAKLARGQAILIRGRDAPIHAGTVAVTALGHLVALGELENGELHPRRIFNLQPRS
ncbi:tRNA pseudouridine(55) synthase TruB [Chelatococcus reniformis]|uniref:tRNA pseudouridine synthase B n=1 Tax=Chelatococcus reniformis TaxID=1494448 RepID=A0A916TZ46_9HYPH|nr:tRNA pseudouridine(55) synthase TruB [Chelatococcus reniformis]GGC52189.1 tRNA pseudouridine synthase B [Chelatococcus reniformis]